MQGEKSASDTAEGRADTVSRRTFGVGGLATAALAYSTGAPHAAPQQQAVATKPDPRLQSFRRLSEALTGLTDLNDPTLLREYRSRCEQNFIVGPQLSRLLSTFEDIEKSNGDVRDGIRRKIVDDVELWPAAQQIIYVWYTSAFRDEGAWLYGPVHHFSQARIWGVIGSHTPMVQGQDWWDVPKLPKL